MVKLNLTIINFLFLFLIQLTPDINFVLDKHPKFSNIIIGAGFSGESGFGLIWFHSPQVYKKIIECALKSKTGSQGWTTFLLESVVSESLGKEVPRELAVPFLWVPPWGSTVSNN